MTDIVERLRARANDKFTRDHPLIAEAAEEIERLRDALATCRELREYDRKAKSDTVHNRPAHNNPQLFGPGRDDTR